MNTKLVRLRVAALCALACVGSAAYADGVWVTWQAPTQNEDNTPLTDVCGYFLYAGPSPDRMVRVAWAGVQATRLLLPEYWGPAIQYFAMTTLNNDGVESVKSPILGVTGDPL
jgi:hypothetical protein